MATRHIEVVRCYEAEGARIRGGVTQLQQALLQIIEHAVRAVDEGGTVTLSTVAHHNMATIHVHHNGASLSADQLAQVFEPFQGELANGLWSGLAIARRIIEEHDGDLTAKSGDGVTCITMSIPLARKAPQQAQGVACVAV